MVEPVTLFQAGSPRRLIGPNKDGPNLWLEIGGTLYQNAKVEHPITLSVGVGTKVIFGLNENQWPYFRVVRQADHWRLLPEGNKDLPTRIPYQSSVYLDALGRDVLTFMDSFEVRFSATRFGNGRVIFTVHFMDLEAHP